MAQMFQQLVESNRQLAANLAHQQQVQQQQAESSQAEMRAVVAALGEMTTRNRGVVDVRQVGKPDNLKGTRDQIISEWQTWAYTFTTWFASQFQNGDKALEWARDNGSTSIDTEALQQQQHAMGWSDLMQINAQLQVALVSLCKDEALTVVRNSAKGAGVGRMASLVQGVRAHERASQLETLETGTATQAADLRHPTDGDRDMGARVQDVLRANRRGPV